MVPRFAGGRPVGRVTEDVLGRVCGAVAAEGKRVFVPVRDAAAWHAGRRVRRWVARHNRRVSRAKAGCRIRVRGPPVTAPGLDPIEPRWAHGKRALVGPDRKPTADEITHRVFAHFGCIPTEPLKQDAK